MLVSFPSSVSFLSRTEQKLLLLLLSSALLSLNEPCQERARSGRRFFALLGAGRERGRGEGQGKDVRWKRRQKGTRTAAGATHKHRIRELQCSTFIIGLGTTTTISNQTLLWRSKKEKLKWKVQGKKHQRCLLKAAAKNAGCIFFPWRHLRNRALN